MPDPEQMLTQYLRETLHLTGTKVGCSEGGCGACTVMISKYDRIKKTIKHYSVVACLMPLCSVHGLSITTIEGIGSTRDKLHPVQERIAKSHGSQCGFCTPGIAMSMYALLRNNIEPDLKDIQKALQANLCRCTGYRPIIDGYKTFIKESPKACQMGDRCCKITGNKIEDKLFDVSQFIPYDPSQEPIFPPELKESNILDKDCIMFKGPRVTWYRPVNLKQLLEIKRIHPNARIVGGNTEIGLEIKLNYEANAILIYVDRIHELNTIEETGIGLKIGANICLSDWELVLKEQVNTKSEHETRLFKALLDGLHRFSGTQIRNVATAIGNIMTSSPISDLNPIFLVSDVR